MPNQTVAKQSDEPCSDLEKLKLCKAAISHIINAIVDDPRKYWLLGNGTGSWEKLTTAAAALWNQPAAKIRADFKPRTEEYHRYCAQRDQDEKLLEYCRENGITGKHE